MIAINDSQRKGIDILQVVDRATTLTLLVITILGACGIMKGHPYHWILATYGGALAGIKCIRLLLQDKTQPGWAPLMLITALSLTVIASLNGLNILTTKPYWFLMTPTLHTLSFLNERLR